MAENFLKRKFSFWSCKTDFQNKIKEYEKKIEKINEEINAEESMNGFLAQLDNYKHKVYYPWSSINNIKKYLHLVPVFKELVEMQIITFVDHYVCYDLTFYYKKLLFSQYLIDDLIYLVISFLEIEENHDNLDDSVDDSNDEE